MARIMIVGGGCRGRRLAHEMVRDRHAVRITTRSEERRGAIEAAGAQCWVGTPDRLATLRGALDGVAIVCWLVATASGSPAELAALHTSRLELFLTQAIDTTMRGFVYESAIRPQRGASSRARVVATAGLAEGERIARALTARNAIPAAFLTADPRNVPVWLEQATAAIASLLNRP